MWILSHKVLHNFTYLLSFFFSFSFTVFLIYKEWNNIKNILKVQYLTYIFDIWIIKFHVDIETYKVNLIMITKLEKNESIFSWIK